jgi:hypothetical protein
MRRSRSTCGKWDIIDFGVTLIDPDLPENIETNGCFYLSAIGGDRPYLISGSEKSIREEAFRLKHRLTAPGSGESAPGAFADEDVVRKCARSFGVAFCVYEVRWDKATATYDVSQHCEVMDSEGKYKLLTEDIGKKIIRLGLISGDHFVLILPLQKIQTFTPQNCEEIARRNLQQLFDRLNV